MEVALRAWQETGRIFGLGQGVTLRYVGPAPLTNVVVVVNIRTLGAKVELGPEQISPLQPHSFMGADDHVSDIAALFMTQNLLATMPFAACGYVKTIKAGDEMQVVLPDITRPGWLVEEDVHLYCDQGRVGEIAVFKKKNDSRKPPNPKVKH